jgi:hypothetical protein
VRCAKTTRYLKMGILHKPRNELEPRLKAVSSDAVQMLKATAAEAQTSQSTNYLLAPAVGGHARKATATGSEA